MIRMDSHSPDFLLDANLYMLVRETRICYCTYVWLTRLAEWWAVLQKVLSDNDILNVNHSLLLYIAYT